MAHHSAQRSQLRWREGAAFADRQAGEGEGAHRNAGEVADFVAEGGEHSADFAVFAFTQGDLDDAAVAETLGGADFSATGFLAAAAMPITEPDARLHFGQLLGRENTVDDRAICFRHAVTRMRQMLRQLAIIGEQQQPLGIGIEPADREDALTDIGREQIDRADLGPLGDVRAIHALGLVEEEIDAAALRFLGRFRLSAGPSLPAPTRKETDAFAIDNDTVDCGVDKDRQAGDDVSIHFNPPGKHHLLHRPPGCDARRRQHFLNALFHDPGDYRMK